MDAAGAFGGVAATNIVREQGAQMDRPTRQESIDRNGICAGQVKRPDPLVLVVQQRVAAAEVDQLGFPRCDGCPHAGWPIMRRWRAGHKGQCRRSVVVRSIVSYVLHAPLTCPGIGWSPNLGPVHLDREQPQHRHAGSAMAQSSGARTRRRWLEVGVGDVRH